jgi:hypothetical protein
MKRKGTFMHERIIPKSREEEEVVYETHFHISVRILMTINFLFDPLSSLPPQLLSIPPHTGLKHFHLI